MAQPKPPIPLITLGRHRDMALSMERALAPHFYYAAIMGAYSKDVLLTLIETLNPPPRGIVIGGFGPEEERAVKQVVAELDDSKGLRVFAVPPGTIEREGPAGVVNLIRKELGEAFGVAWGAEGGVRRWSDHEPLD